MNGFSRHGIEHTSASQINMWDAAPCAWVAKYLYGMSFNFSPAAKCGVYVEEAVAQVLTGRSDIDKAVNTAREMYNKEIVLSTVKADLQRAEQMEGMIRDAVKILRPFGSPKFNDDYGQIEIALTCKGEGWELPVKGFLDFYYPDKNLIIDLKTTLRCPSTLSASHAMQGAIYKQATGADVKFLYVTGNKHNLIDLENHADYLAQAKIILSRQEKMLSRFTAEDLKDMIPVRRDSFYWTGDENIRAQLYGL